VAQLREEHVLYLDPSGTVVRWNASSNCVVCTCDATSQCTGNRRLGRCKRKRPEQCAETVPVTRGGEAGGPAATNATTGTLLPREVRALEAMKVIPASQSPRHCQVIVVDNGRWDTSLEKLEGYTSKGYKSGGALSEPFPLRPGAKWRRPIGGAHARVVGKDTVTIIFEISISTANPARPVFWARDFVEGAFAPSFSSASVGGLELAWLSQKHGEDDAELRLSDMKGGRFTGLDIQLLGAHFRSLTPGFVGFRAGVQGRGRGKEEVGPR
jgi:hypothetical protein